MRYRIVFVSTLLLAATLGPRDARGCDGDFNDDGQVTINEVITAVVNGLNGCPPMASTSTPTKTLPETPTPTATPTSTPTSATPTRTATVVAPPCVPPSRAVCGGSFFQDNVNDPSLPTCGFVGSWSSFCGNNQLVAGWASDGFNIVLGLVEPVVFFSAQAIDRNHGRLTGWWSRPNATDFTPIMGTVSMSPNTAVLQISPIGSPFSIAGCAFEAYTGRYFNDLPGFTFVSPQTAASFSLLPEMLRALEQQSKRRAESAGGGRPGTPDLPFLAAPVPAQ